MDGPRRKELLIRVERGWGGGGGVCGGGGGVMPWGPERSPGVRDYAPQSSRDSCPKKQAMERNRVGPPATSAPT